RHDIVRSRNENLEVLFGKTEFPPFNEFVKLQAHPTFLIDTCTKENLDIGFELSSMEIPAIRSYHFYGAIITAQRMSSLNIPLSVAEQFNAFLVAQYKNHNGIKNKEKIEYLKTIYRLGTRYVYLCR
ncbi:MAG TPA: hypothetical protein VN132_03070, partial [Bdellovibrio sp.]|nr:hypothetical protein [Bdellovibrio sp.]